MEIIIRHWRVSPYAICFLMSFVCAYIYVALKLRKQGIIKRYIFYMMMLNTVLILYFGLVYTVVTQLIQGNGIRELGFSSLGGMMGMMLGVFIFSKISPDSKTAVFRENIKALGLMYSVSKLGCFFAGCCYGMKYDGPGKIRYVDPLAKTQSPWYFPVQLVESICFLAAFIIINAADRKPEISKAPQDSVSIEPICIVTYSALKFALDYLRYYPERHIFTVNQWVCLMIIVLLILSKVPRIIKDRQ